MFKMLVWINNQPSEEAACECVLVSMKGKTSSVKECR
jgi:hypothetical protein